MKYRVKTDNLRFQSEGDILEKEGNLYYGGDQNDCIRASIVENNPDWFEPIDQTPDITINGHKAEEYNGKLTFACTEVEPEHAKALREAIQKYDLDIVRSGERINKQVHQIAQYYE